MEYTKRQVCKDEVFSLLQCTRDQIDKKWHTGDNVARLAELPTSVGADCSFPQNIKILCLLTRELNRHDDVKWL